MNLTETEIEVLKLKAKGLSSFEASQKKFCSKRTIDWHLDNAYKKLGVKNITQALKSAKDQGYRLEE